MPVRSLSEIRCLVDRGDVPSLTKREEDGGLLLILQLGATNDEQGTPDEDVRPRAELVVQLHQFAEAAGRHTLVLTSGGVDPNFPFNPTNTPHWVYVSKCLLDLGLPERALLSPGLPALHTVEEALLCHELVARYNSRFGCANIQLIIVTSDYHAPRARHLFGIAHGEHVALPVWCEVIAAPSNRGEEFRFQREAHEKRALETLRTAPFGPWLEFINAHGVAAANRSRRFSRRMVPIDLMALCGVQQIEPETRK